MLITCSFINNYVHDSLIFADAKLYYRPSALDQMLKEKHIETVKSKILIPNCTLLSSNAYSYRHQTGQIAPFKYGLFRPVS